jgi:hypothetical protein
MTCVEISVCLYAGGLAPTASLAQLRPLVTPPDETESIRVAFSHPVCGNGRIQQSAYQTAPV